MAKKWWEEGTDLVDSEETPQNEWWKSGTEPVEEEQADEWWKAGTESVEPETTAPEPSVPQATKPAEAPDIVQQYGDAVTSLKQKDDLLSVNKAMYENLASMEQRTPEQEQRLSDSWRSIISSQADISRGYDEVQKLQPQYEKYIADQKQARTDYIEGFRSNGIFGDEATQALYDLDARAEQDFEAARSIEDLEKRKQAFADTQAKYQAEEKTLLSGYLDRFKAREADINKAALLIDQAKQMGLDVGTYLIEVDNGPSEEEFAAMATEKYPDGTPKYTSEVIQNLRDERAFKDFLLGGEGNILGQAEMQYRLASGAEKAGLVNNEIRISPLQVWDREGIIQQINSFDVSDAKKKAAIANISRLQEESAKMELPFLKQVREFNSFVKDNKLENASPRVQIEQWKSRTQNWWDYTTATGKGVAMGLVRGALGMLSAGQAIAGSVASLAGPNKYTDYLIDSSLKTEGERQRLARISQEIGGLGFAGDLAEVVPQIFGQVAAGGAIGLGGRALGVSRTAASNIAFGSSIGMEAAQAYGNTLTNAIQQLEKQKIDSGMDPIRARAEALKEAQLPAALTGLTTAAVTLLGGKKGVESFANLGVEGIKAKLMSSQFKAQLPKLVPELFEGATNEAVEEWAQTFAEGIIEQSTFNPSLSTGDIINNAFKGALLGGIAGGSVSGVKYGFDYMTAPSEMARRKTFMDQINSSIASAEREISETTALSLSGTLGREYDAMVPSTSAASMGATTIDQNRKNALQAERQQLAKLLEDQTISRVARNQLEARLISADANYYNEVLRPARINLLVERTIDLVRNNPAGINANIVSGIIKIASGKGGVSLSGAERASLGITKVGERYIPASEAPLVKAEFDGTFSITDAGKRTIEEYNLTPLTRIIGISQNTKNILAEQARILEALEAQKAKDEAVKSAKSEETKTLAPESGKALEGQANATPDSTISDEDKAKLADLVRQEEEANVKAREALAGKKGGPTATTAEVALPTIPQRAQPLVDVLKKQLGSDIKIDVVDTLKGLERSAAVVTLDKDGSVNVNVILSGIDALAESYKNPEALQRAVEKIADEEADHVAAIKTIGYEGVLAAAERLSPAEREAVAKLYISRSNFATDDEYNNAIKEFAATKDGMTQEQIDSALQLIGFEHLRQIGQRVRSGQTTEDIFNAEMANPSVVKSVLQYLAKLASQIQAKLKVRFDQKLQEDLNRIEEYRKSLQAAAQPAVGAAPEVASKVVQEGEKPPSPVTEGGGIPVSPATTEVGVTEQEAQKAIDDAKAERAKKTPAKVTKNTYGQDVVLKPNKIIGKTLREALLYASRLNLSSIAATNPNELMMQDVAAILAQLKTESLDNEKVVKLEVSERGRAGRYIGGDVGMPRSVKESVEVLVHEVGHLLTADQVRKYLPRRQIGRGKNYLNGLNKIINDQTAPEPVRRLFSLYVSTIEQLGIAEQYFGDKGIAGTPHADESKAIGKRLQAKGRLRKDLTGSQLYGLANVEEFVSQTFSNVQFRDLLKSLKDPTNPKRTLWTAFVEAIQRILNLPKGSMAAAVIEASVDISMEVPTPRTEGAMRQRGKIEPSDIVSTDEDARFLELAKDPEANREELQKMVDEAARRAGYDVGTVYHGTNHSFNKFSKKVFANFNNAQKKLGFFFTPEKDYAQQYGGRVINAYLRGNFKEESRSLIDEIETDWTNQKAGSYVARLKREGFDGVIFDGATKEIAVFTPEQIKSADPVTYDDQGNIIPLSQRFDITRPEIDYTEMEPAERRVKRTFQASPQQLDQNYRQALAGMPSGVSLQNMQKVIDNIAKQRRYQSQNLLFHGTTHIFNVFNKDLANIENDFGKGYYLTNTEADARINYAGEGPDLTNRIERLAEQIASNEDISDEEAKARAKAILSGGGQRIIRAYVRLDNPFNVGGPSETFLDYEMPYNEETEEYGEPTGKLVDFINALRPIIESYAEDSAVDADKAIGNIVDRAIDYGGITASDLVKILKQEDSGIMWAADQNGDSATGEIIRQAIEDSGFDGIVDSLVNEKFGTGKKTGKSMAGMGPDTVHTIVFNSNQIKSADPITRNEQGEVIMPSQRFDETRPEMEYAEVPEGPTGLVEGQEIQLQGGNLLRAMRTQSETQYAGKIGVISGKEIFQNAVDAIMKITPEQQAQRGVPRAIYVGTQSKFYRSVLSSPERIKIESRIGGDLSFEEREKRGSDLIVYDTGTGMTPAVILDKFLRAFESGKTVGEGGGFGQAKLAFLGGSKYFKIASVAEDSNGKKYVTILEGAGEAFYLFNLQPPKVIPKENTKITLAAPSGEIPMTIEYFEVPRETITGTAILSEIPEGVGDGARGGSNFVKTYVKYIDGISFVNMDDLIGGGVLGDRASFLNYPQKQNTPLEFLGFSTPDISSLNEIKMEFGVLKSIDLPSATIDFLARANDAYKKTTYISPKILNRSIYQFEQNIFFPEEVALPSEVIVNIKPKVPAGSKDYPFKTDRENLAGTVKSEIDQYFKNVGQEAIKKLNERFETAKNAAIPIANSAQSFLDVGQKNDQATLNTIVSSPSTFAINEDIAFGQNQILNTLSKMYPDKFGRATYAGLITGGRSYGVHFGIPRSKDPSTIWHDPWLQLALAKESWGKSGLADPSYPYFDFDTATDQEINDFYDFYLRQSYGVSFHEALHQIVDEEGEGLARELTFRTGDLLYGFLTSTIPNNRTTDEKRAILKELDTNGETLALSVDQTIASQFITSQGGYSGYALAQRSGETGAREQDQREAFIYPKIGVNINDSTQNFTQQILDGDKTIETRDSDSLRPYVGKTVGIVRTGQGQATLVGYATIGEPKVYKTEAEFRADADKHLVAPKSEWDIKEGGVKYGYPLTDVRSTTPTPVTSQGRIGRAIPQPQAEMAPLEDLEIDPTKVQPQPEGTAGAEAVRKMGDVFRMADEQSAAADTPEGTLPMETIVNAWISSKRGVEDLANAIMRYTNLDADVAYGMAEAINTQMNVQKGLADLTESRRRKKPSGPERRRYTFGKRLAEELPSDVASRVKKFYEVMTNEMSVEEANAVFNRAGLSIDEAIDAAMEMDNGMSLPVRSMLAMIIERKLIEGRNNYRRKGDAAKYDEAVDKHVKFFNWFQEYSKEMGQGVQAFAKFANLGADGMLRKVKRDMERIARNNINSRRNEIDKIKSDLESEDKQAFDAAMKANTERMNKAANNAAKNEAKKMTVEEQARLLAQKAAKRVAGETAKPRTPDPLSDLVNSHLRKYDNDFISKATALGVSLETAQAIEESAKKLRDSRVAAKGEKQRFDEAQKERMRVKRKMAEEKLYLYGERPTIWEDYQSVFSQKLARSLMRDPNAKAKIPPALLLFTDRLTENLLGFIPQKQRSTSTPKDFQAMIEDALNNKDRYQEAFNRAMEDMSSQIEELEARMGGGEAVGPKYKRAVAAQEFMAKIESMIADFPVSESLVNSFVKQKSKDLGISILEKYNEWYRSSRRDRFKIERELQNILVENVNVPIVEASKLANAIVEDFRKKAEQRRIKALERFKNPKQKATPVKQTPLQKFFELTNMGALTDEQAYEIMANRFELPVWDEKFANWVYEMAQDIQGMDDQLRRRLMTQNLMAEISRKKGFNAADLGAGFVYANMLSSPDTHMVNILDTAINNFANGFADFLATKDPSRLIGIVKGYRKGWVEAMEVMKTGRRINMPGFEEKTPLITELARFGKKGGVPMASNEWANGLIRSLLESKPARILNAGKWISRLLEAQDALNFAASVEGQRYASAAAIAKNEGLKGDDKFKRVAEILNLGDKVYQDALKQAESEGYIGAEAKFRAIEIQDSAIPEEIKRASFERGLRDVYRNMPTGMAGYMASSLNNAIMGIKNPWIRNIARLTASPFVITPTNIFNKWLDWSPYGYKRLFLGSGGAFGTDSKFYVAPFKRGTPEYRAQLFKANSSVVVLGMLYGLIKAGLITLTGRGPSDEEEKKQWKADGNKAYTIRIGNGPAIPFAYTPWAIPLSVMANIVNWNQYNAKDDSSFTYRFLVSMALIPSVIMELPFFQGPADVIELFSPKSKTDPLKRIEKFAEGKVGMLFPNLLRYVDRLFDPTEYDSDSIKGIILDQTPFARRLSGQKLNMFGEPIGEGKAVIERLAGRVVSFPKASRESRVLAKYDAYPYMPNPRRAVALTKGVKTPMTEEQYSKFAIGVGQEFKKFINSNFNPDTPASDAELVRGKERIHEKLEEIKKRWVRKVSTY